MLNHVVELVLYYKQLQNYFSSYFFILLSRQRPQLSGFQCGIRSIQHHCRLKPRTERRLCHNVGLWFQFFLLYTKNEASGRQRSRFVMLHQTNSKSSVKSVQLEVAPVLTIKGEKKKMVPKQRLSNWRWQKGMCCRCWCVFLVVCQHVDSLPAHSYEFNCRTRGQFGWNVSFLWSLSREDKRKRQKQSLKGRFNSLEKSSHVHVIITENLLFMISVGGLLPKPPQNSSNTQSNTFRTL